MNIFNYLFPKYIIDKNKKVRLISLFSGYDSQKLAFDYLNIDVEHYKAIEFDKYAIQTLNEIHNSNFKQSDIKTVKGEDLEIIDKDKYTYLLTYSFPCQDLSLAGNRKGMNKNSATRSGLLWEVERLLKETKHLPDVLIMENVKQVITADGWYEWNIFLESLGYSNYVEVLNAKDYGIPQNRERCFMVSILGDYNYTFPKKFGLELRLKDFLEKTVDEKYFWNTNTVKTLRTFNYDDIDYKWNVKVKYFIWNENIDFNNTYSLNAYNKSISDISHTITTPHNVLFILHNGKIRKLTPRECFRLMGVKDIDYNKITCSESQKYKLAGNSIVTTILMAIYSQLFENCDYEYYIDKLIEDLRSN